MINGKDLTKHEFDIINARRGELIDKKHSGFTAEESSRRFDEHPGWKDECERRYRANLTDAERDEFEDLQRITGEYLDHNFPLPLPPIMPYYEN